MQISSNGEEFGLTWREIHRRSSQLADALAQRGLGHGDRLGIGLRNSPQFLFSVLAAWKLGAVPVPMRWDLPDWERSRLEDAIDARICLTAQDLHWIDATAGRDVFDLPDVVSPQMTASAAVVRPDCRKSFSPTAPAS